MRALSLACCAFVALALAVSASADVAPPPIATDRPGFCFNNGVVGKGVTQLEMGLPQVVENDSGVQVARGSSFFPLVRVGVSACWEVRLDGPLYNWLSVTRAGRDRRASGKGDLELGAKWHAQDQAGRKPAICLIPSVIMPTGDRTFSLRKPAATLNAVLDWTSAKAWEGRILLGLENGGLPGTRRRFSQETCGLYGGKTVGKWTWYGESAAVNSDAPGSGLGTYAGAGVEVLLTHDVQLDLAFDRGLNALATDWLYGLGLSVRF